MRTSLIRCFGLIRLLGIWALLAGLTAEGVSAQVYPLKVGPNSRYLVDQNGSPFFLNAECGWSVIVQIEYSEADRYLTDRAARGFNGIWVGLIEHKFADHAPANIQNISPWTGDPFATPNEPYFVFADSVISRAQKLGICVLLTPIYLGSDPSQGWSKEVGQASYATMKAWGAYVGNRYKRFPNIIWVMGGDTPPGRLRDKIDTMVAGMKSADSVYPERLYTTHSERGSLATTHWPETWVTLNNIYVNQWTLVLQADAAYNSDKKMPFFLIEGDFEYAEGGATAQEVRSEAYWTVLRGGAGHTFGNAPIWFFSSTTTGPRGAWQEQLGSPGSVSMTHFSKLVTSRNWWTLVPDLDGTVITAGAGLGIYLATFARATDSTCIIGYLPSRRSVTINPGSLRGDSIQVTWYNPATGDYFDTGTYSKISRSYLPPTVGDWVLVIDARVAER